MRRGHGVALAAAFALGALVPARGAEPPLTAVVADLSGKVTIVSGAEATVRGGPEALTDARRFRVLGRGDEVIVPEGAGLVLVCSDDRLVRLEGPVRRTVGPALCRQGIEAPRGYSALAPVAGRVRIRADGLRLLEKQVRTIEEEDPTVPVVLAPRRTAVREERPAIIWRGVERAVEYEIDVSGGDWTSIRLDRSEVACAPTPDGLVDGAVCTMPWLPGQPGLPPGQVAFLTVRARTSLVGPWRAAPEASRFSRLPVRDAEAVESRLVALSSLPEGAARHLLEAGAFADSGLLAEASRAYREALAAGAPPEASVALGDVYQMMDLLRPAARRYQKAMAASEDPAVHAAAELGLGLVERARRSPAARSHFERARDLYRASGFIEEAAEAERLMAAPASGP